MNPNIDPDIADHDPRSSQDSADSNGLTGTPGRIQLAATDAGSTMKSEQDAAIVESFISTLAKIALSAAARQKNQSDRSG